MSLDASLLWVRDLGLRGTFKGIQRDAVKSWLAQSFEKQGVKIGLAYAPLPISRRRDLLAISKPTPRASWS